MKSNYPSHFLRTHNSYIVNIHHIVKYLKGRYGTLLMINDIEIPISLPKKKVSDRLGLHL
ncbi:MAG: LytTR family transcriptional regulator DNA-binding domain-containing protein [Bacteroidetes bacterium]|nr:LytTR family transcriptional regulator DNA-binding domain-containing protein [Bacteroidota bacterium]